jgi:hypothetical protein
LKTAELQGEIDAFARLGRERYDPDNDEPEHPADQRADGP